MREKTVAERSDRFFDQPRTQAASADANALVGAADDRAHGLDIGIEDAPGLVVGMAHIVSGGRFLLTEFTLKCHGSYSFLSGRFSQNGGWYHRRASLDKRTDRGPVGWHIVKAELSLADPDLTSFVSLSYCASHIVPPG